MAEYIEREALLENLKRQYGEDLGWQGTVNMSDVGMMIEDAPTADVVEVVRCGDCKYWSRRDGCIPFSHLHKCYRQYGAVMGKDDFCSLGEKGECAYD